MSVVNHSDANFQLRNLSDYSIRRHGPVIEVAPNDTTNITFQIMAGSKDLWVEFEVMNTLVAPNTFATIRFDISVPKE